jgi:signal peptidase I
MKKKIVDILHWSFIMFLIILGALIIKIFVFEIYKIPTGSMEPTLLPGDYIIVEKLSYGARLFQLKKLFYENKQEYIRIRGLSQIKKNDIIVFNFPDYESYNNERPSIYGVCQMVKRCIGLPGDSIMINCTLNKGNDLNISKIKLYPQDSSFNWTIDKYGPIYVPQKGDQIVLNKKNIALYWKLMRFENPSIQVNRDSIFINNKLIYKYTFQHNYFFMKGDNFYYSQDSRYWGFLPECNIIGKVNLIIISLDTEANWKHSLRWQRIFHFVH